MTAQQARRLAQKQLKEHTSNQFEKVYININAAIRKGEFECRHYGSLSSNVIDVLRKDGYEVKECSDDRYNERTYLIKW